MTAPIKPTEATQRRRFGLVWWLRWLLLAAFAVLVVMLHDPVARGMCAVLAIAQCLYIADGIVKYRSEVSS